jgi:hypothetical protein
MTKAEAQEIVAKAEALRQKRREAQQRWLAKTLGPENEARKLLGLPAKGNRRGPVEQKFTVVSVATGRVFEGNVGVLVSIFGAARAQGVKDELRAKKEAKPLEPATWVAAALNSTGNQFHVTYQNNAKNVFTIEEEK